MDYGRVKEEGSGREWRGEGEETRERGK